MQTLQPFCRSILLCFLLPFIAFKLLAQDSSLFHPLPHDSIAGVKLLAQINQQCKQDVNNISGTNRKYISELYQERVDHIKTLITHKELINAPEAENYLGLLTSHIITANPVLSGLHPHFHFSRSSVPNAASMGEGTIIFNIGLFAKLDNEAQVAFVLCHELAHLYLNHSNDRITKHIEAINSRETQRELRKIKNASYQQNAQLDALIEKFSFSNSRHSRYHESEADSMAVVLLGNTSFAVAGATSCLAILDAIDEEKFDTETSLTKIFNNTNYPFKKRWIEKEEGLLGGHAVLVKDKKKEDSLKTHPDCQERIKRINKSLTANTGKSFVVSEEQFNAFRKRFRYEVVEHYYNSNNLSASLYFAIQLLNEYPKDVYIIATIGKIMSRLYVAQKSHRLSSCTKQPSPDYSLPYNTLLQFIQNLYLEEIASVNYFFLQQYEQQLQGNEDFVYALINSKLQNDKAEEHTFWRAYYEKSFHPKKYKFN